MQENKMFFTGTIIKDTVEEDIFDDVLVEQYEQNVYLCQSTTHEENCEEVDIIHMSKKQAIELYQMLKEWIENE